MDFNIEIVHLKEEFLKEIRELESKLINMFFKKSLEIDEKNKLSLEKIDIMMNKNEQMFNSINKQQIKLEKIGELESFKNKTNDMIITHEFRIKNISKDLDDIKFRYEREIIQNLSVPGFIGPSCQFKTISEYLLFNINEINKIKIDKDLTKKENKEIKSKFDTIMKNMLNLVDNSVTRCNEYTDNKQKYFEKLLNTKLIEFNEKNMEMKTKVLTNQRVVENEINKLLNLSDELMKIKNDVTSIINNKYDELNLGIKELKYKTDKLNNEIKKNNRNYENLNNNFKAYGLLNNKINNGILKTVNNPINQKLQKRETLIHINNSHNNNEGINIFKKENNKKANNSERSGKKLNTIIQREKIGINDFIKNNKNQIIDKASFHLNKKRKSLNNKEFSILNKPLSNKKREEFTNKAKSLKNIKNNTNLIKTQYNNIFNNKKEINDINYNDVKLSTERRIKYIQKKIKDNNKRKATLSDDEKDNSSNKTKFNKFFEKISLFTNNINHESQNKYKINENLNYKNKNEIHNLKTFNIFNKSPSIALDSKNNLILEKFTERNIQTEFEENKNINYKNKNIINLYKYKKEPALTTQKITNLNFPNEQMISKINKKEDIFQEFLERHKLKLNISSEKKSRNQKHNNYEVTTISNRMYGTRSNNYYNDNNEYHINNQNKSLKEIKKYDLNFAQTKAKKNILKKNNINLDIPENINYKLISIDYNFNSPLKKKKNKTGNDEELILPITNIFKTFQVNKYKNIINNISEDFPNKIIPIFEKTRNSLYSKKMNKHNSIKKINIYKRMNNKNQSDLNLGIHL